MMYPVYMQYTENQLRKHFADVKINNQCNPTWEKHIQYYKNSLGNYKNSPEDRKGKSINALKIPCQVEKDELFWTASCLMTIFYSKKRTEELINLFQKAFGDRPHLNGIDSWNDCFDGELHLSFETNLPSPKSYKRWLRENLRKQQFIPYILDSDNGKKNLEGPTHVDAILLNKDNGFAVVIEAKVLSDISCQITYDVSRNQIARNIDVMLEENDDLCPPLNYRDPDKTFFLLLTPRLFKNNPSSRLYGYKMEEYKKNSESLKFDLRHRPDINCANISKRIGWLSWEDFKDVNHDCCGWL